MPEGLEVELYRRAAESVVGRRICSLVVDDRVAGPGVPEAVDGELPGVTVLAVRRIGKQLLVDTEGGVIGIHFGMTGRIVVDDRAPIDALEYGSDRDDPAWDRIRIDFAEGGSLRVNDPRRWCRLTIDPDVTRLGPDLFWVTLEDLGRASTGRTRSIKAVLLDQACVAGLGNLCVDEILWHAGIAPARPAGELGGSELSQLHRSLMTCLPQMLALGGSHRGVVSPALRGAMPPCPLDGSSLRRDRIGGRTTVWCPVHQT